MSVVLDSLKHNFGETVIQALEDDNVIEIMLNDDGRLWLDTFDNGMMPVSEINPSAAAGILSQVASMLGTVVTKDQPIVEGELPIDGSRFEGLFPPVVANPTFTIRKKATKIFTLENYVNAGIMAPDQRQLICEFITTRKNILVVGGTGSGKTTLTNAILAELAEIAGEDRLVIIEDTNELQCLSKNKVMLRTNQTTNMQHLLKATMRLRPDRIIVGEVRGREALDLLKAWNTGHPGGVCTVHANSCTGGLIRLQQLIAEAVTSPMDDLIKEAIDLVIFIKRTKQGRKIDDIAVIEDDQGTMEETHKLRILK